MPSTEINFDGIVGPTHNYAGLSWGNVASIKNKQSISNPREAALQGLEKMKFLHDLGVKQAVLPPHERPHLLTLRKLGFSGSDGQVLARVAIEDRTLLSAVSSASAMWAANAATVSPSADSADNKVHFTPANLISTFHRSLESSTTAAVLKRIFADESSFTHHDPLPATMMYSDEGAANHTRLCWHPDRAGIQIFTYGRVGNESATLTTFPARQSLYGSRAIARLHQLKEDTTFFVKQNPRAIDAGAFHNDVVSVGHRHCLLIHESAWEDQPAMLDNISREFNAACGASLHIIEVSEAELSLAEAVGTYLFNSQLVTLPDDSIALIAPIECRDNPSARNAIERIFAAENPISSVCYVDVRQSMQNGGGPACLRLRVTLNNQQLHAMHQGVLWSDKLYITLKNWIARHYRDHLTAADLADPKLLDESKASLDELTSILSLGPIYSFQQ
jgi:succinylarginine dihydrolase